ncbi:ATP-binding cassette, subfamily B [Actinobaculum suis]|uniref:ATP-binding cassette, subfamily B n=1 Tax=Actinobaculum suis TaxID=1657 RepID=A0A1G7EVJ7_9ACTO|nr:hypothetical protein [Actinobaculum suis]MDY5153190.1 hypothetical protein [Actinobaculum suis]SDE67724.1 ATP-binding cassette, subfamily B [Actinobaculum suis]
MRTKRLGVVKSCVMALRVSMRVAPGLLMIAIVLEAACALVPAAQVFLVDRLLGSLSTGIPRLVFGWVAVTGVVVAGYLAARSVMYALHRLVQTQTTAWAHARINQRLSELNPEEIADPQVQARGRDAREAILEGRAQLQATSAVSVVSAAVIALSLCFTLGATSWPAALCVCACLIPMTVSNMWYARKDGGMWPRISESRRRATYYENQITYQGTATELATLEARGWVAGRANKYRYEGRAGETQLGML